jgi:hypothetical protein
MMAEMIIPIDPLLHFDIAITWGYLTFARV